MGSTMIEMVDVIEKQRLGAQKENYNVVVSALADPDNPTILKEALDNKNAAMKKRLGVFQAVATTNSPEEATDFLQTQNEKLKKMAAQEELNKVMAMFKNADMSNSLTECATFQEALHFKDSKEPLTQPPRSLIDTYKKYSEGHDTEAWAAMKAAVQRYFDFAGGVLMPEAKQQQASGEGSGSGSGGGGSGMEPQGEGETSSPTSGCAEEKKKVAALEEQLKTCTSTAQQTGENQTLALDDDSVLEAQKLKEALAEVETLRNQLATMKDEHKEALAVKEDEVLKLREEVGKLQQQKRDQAEPSSSTSNSTGAGPGTGSGSNTTIASPINDEQQGTVKPVEDHEELGDGYDSVLPPEDLPRTNNNSESGGSGTNRSKHEEPKAEDTCNAGLFKLRLAHQLTMKLLKQKLPADKGSVLESGLQQLQSEASQLLDDPANEERNSGSGIALLNNVERLTTANFGEDIMLGRGSDDCKVRIATVRTNSNKASEKVSSLLQGN